MKHFKQFLDELNLRFASEHRQMFVPWFQFLKIQSPRMFIQWVLIHLNLFVKRDILKLKPAQIQHFSLRYSCELFDLLHIKNTFQTKI